MSSEQRASSAYLQSANTKLGIVTKLPLRGLWGENGAITASRLRELSISDVIDLLREGEVQFIVADVGSKPRWIDLADCYRFWMDEAKHHMAEPDNGGAASATPGVYSYWASEWHSEEVKVPVIVLEVSH